MASSDWFPFILVQAFYEQLISGSIEEVQEDYAVAMRQAMLDYVLSNPLERQRLGLEGLEPLLVPRGIPAAAAEQYQHNCPLGPPLLPASHAALVKRWLPQEWHEHVAMARCVCGTTC